MAGHGAAQEETYSVTGAVEILLHDPAATGRLGHAVASLARPGDLILLSGDLGAGKTTFIKAMAHGLGIDPVLVTSPTFAIIHEYAEGSIPLVHADLYRLGHGADIMETGLEEYIAGDYAVVIEWAEFLPDEFAMDCLRINLLYVSDTGRKAVVMASGPVWSERLQALAMNLTDRNY